MVVGSKLIDVSKGERERGERERSEEWKGTRRKRGGREGRREKRTEKER